MGEMADMALDRAAIEESLADEYCSGQMSMHDAFDHGFLDASGAEVNMESAWERAFIPTREALHNELRDALADITEVHMHRGEAMEMPRQQLNAEALANLSKANPTCNYCREEMTARVGKFGKFYFCGNYCADQVTVSDKYWQSLK